MAKLLKISDIGFRAEYFSLLLAVLFAVVYNQSLWLGIYNAQTNLSLHTLLFLISCAFFITATNNFLFNLFAYKHIQKLALIIIVLCSAAASYFMDVYNILLDSSMLQNVFQTDYAEARDLLTFSFLTHMFIWGVLPSCVIFKINIKYRPVHKQILANTLSMTSSLIVVALIALMFYQDYASLLRNNRELRYLINPVNYISASKSLLEEQWKSAAQPIQSISQGVSKGPTWLTKNKRSVFIFVVGETARAQEFHLNGYSKQTTPELEKRDILNFSDVSSCGTATAVSLPCMFSKFGRDNYTDKKGRQYESLLDVISDAGMSVSWRDNNSGCKGVCDRVDNLKISHLEFASFCNKNECFDEALLQGLDDVLASTQNDLFIVLHQKGSHGPAYFERVPSSFEQFKPACKTKQLQDCSVDEITNAYDNTILYTDFVLSKIIDYLKSKSLTNDTAMIYASDHGESLGEKNMFLHGAPYFMAPKEQTHIPMIFWISESFENEFGIDRSCLDKKTSHKYSHDNLFHSILGGLDIYTDAYEPELDIFRSCKVKNIVAN